MIHEVVGVDGNDSWLNQPYPIDYDNTLLEKNGVWVVHGKVSITLPEEDGWGYFTAHSSSETLFQDKFETSSDNEDSEVEENVISEIFTLNTAIVSLIIICIGYFVNFENKKVSSIHFDFYVLLS